MATSNSSSGVPQFGKAEYSASQTGRCGLCQQPLGSSYYRVKQTVVCEGCALRAKSEMPSNSHSAFASAVVCGIIGAVLGLIAYSVFTIETGIEIGFVSLAVGYLVGKAMNLGSRGSGGRRYQVVAVLLTYAAVSLSAIPISIAQYAKEKRIQQSAQVSSPSSSNNPEATSNSNQSPAVSSSAESRPPLWSTIGSLLFIGLVSPFLELQQDPTNGAIGLLILFVGMRFAWRLTAGTELGAVLGPFTNRSAPAAPPAAL